MWRSGRITIMGVLGGELVDTSGGAKRAEPPGRVNEDAKDDRIWNGADDDGSGTVTILAIAKAFALGPRPRRSLLFVWHSGEERGLWGSRFFADHPTVPLDRIGAQINMDMVGRNRDDRGTKPTRSTWSAQIASAPNCTTWR